MIPISSLVPISDEVSLHSNLAESSFKKSFPFPESPGLLWPVCYQESLLVMGSSLITFGRQLSWMIKSIGNLLQKSCCFPCSRSVLSGFPCDCEGCPSGFANHSGPVEAPGEMGDDNLGRAMWMKWSVSDVQSGPDRNGGPSGWSSTIVRAIVHLRRAQSASSHGPVVSHSKHQKNWSGYKFYGLRGEKWNWFMGHSRAISRHGMRLRTVIEAEFIFRRDSLSYPRQIFRKSSTNRIDESHGQKHGHIWWYGFEIARISFSFEWPLWRTLKYLTGVWSIEDTRKNSPGTTRVQTLNVCSCQFRFGWSGMRR
jgi:hypothetical protein